MPQIFYALFVRGTDFIITFVIIKILTWISIASTFVKKKQFGTPFCYKGIKSTLFIKLSTLCGISYLNKVPQVVWFILMVEIDYTACRIIKVFIYKFYNIQLCEKSL